MREKMFDTIEQVSFVVERLEETVHFLADELGIGPWKLFHFGFKEQDEEFNQLAVKVEHTILYGKEIGSYNVRVAACTLGTSEIELIQPEDGKSLFAQYLRNYGSGGQHVAVSGTGSFSEVLGIMAANGYPLGQLAKIDDIEDCAFVDHMRTFGTYMELHRRPEDFSFPDALFKKRYPEGVCRNSPVFSAVEAIVFDVRDLEEARTVLEDAYGIGLWQEKSADGRVRKITSNACNIGLTLMQPTGTPTVAKQYMEENGPGILGITVKPSISLEEFTERVVKASGKAPQRLVYENGDCDLFFDLRKWFGAYLIVRQAEKEEDK